MMRVAHLTFSGAFGGREKVAFSLVAALREHAQAKLYLVVEERADAAARADLLEHLAKYNAPVKLLSTTGMFSRHTLRELAEELRRDGVQIVHSHCHKSMFYALLLRYFENLKIVTVITLHGLKISFTAKFPVHHGLNILGMLLTDGIIGCSREIVSTLSNLPFISGKVTVIRNNLTLAPDTRYDKEREREELRKHFVIPSKKKVWIGNASRLTRQKNISLFVKLAIHLVQNLQRDDLLFIVAGDGELRDPLRKQVEEAQLGDSFLFTGFLTDMQGFYHALDLFVLTSDWEGTPMALLEAMAAGLPVVASSVGGVPDVVVDGESGILYPRGDLVACAEAVIGLLNDQTKAHRMGEAGKQRIIEEFTEERWVREHVNYYERLLRQQGTECQ